jgi:hypothetical protein
VNSVVETPVVAGLVTHGYGDPSAVTAVHGKIAAGRPKVSVISPATTMPITFTVDSKQEAP